MNEFRTSIILGGDGFVGRAVVEKYLKNNWQVIIPTKAENEKIAREKLLLHGSDKKLLEEFISNKSLLFAFKINLTDKKWCRSENWLKLFNELNVTPYSIFRIINFVGKTSGPVNEILKSNIDTLESIFTLARLLKSQNKGMLFINMGSTAEKKLNKTLSPYDYTKKTVREKIEKSGLCDFHFVAQYVKGKGEQKMKLAAPILWNKLKFSRKWLFGFKVSIIDVDDLAEIIYHLIEVVKIRPQKERPIEVNVTNGELLFGEVIKNLLPEEKRNIPDKTIIPTWMEDIFLWVYATLIPLIKPKDQFSRRLASFAKRSLKSSRQEEMLEPIKTAAEIKKLAMDNKNYVTIETNPNLIVSHRNKPLIYVLREKNKEELERVVQKALTTSH